jgi:hypothetical protein
MKYGTAFFITFKKKHEMKKIFITILALVSLQFAYSQAVETQIDYGKIKVTGATIEVAVPEDVAADVIKAEMKARGFGKGDGTKGYTLYKGVNFNELSADKVDFYIKTEKKSKKDKGNSKITAMVSKGYDNFISSTTDAAAMTALISFLNNLKPKFTSSNLDVQIAAQEDVVKKEEKKQENITEDISDMEKKIAKLQKDIADKKNDLEKQKAEVEKQRSALAALKAKKS